MAPSAHGFAEQLASCYTLRAAAHHVDDTLTAFTRTLRTMSVTLALHATTMGCSLTCKDIATSLAFYRDVLRFEVAGTYDRDGRLATAVIVSGQIRVVLNQDDGQLGWDRIKGQGLFLQFNVAAPADVDAAAARLAAAGGTFIDQPADRPWGVRMFQFRDPDGFKLGISTPLAG